MAIELTEFSKSLTYRTAAPVSGILQDLDQIAELDRLAEAKQRQFGWMLAFSIVGIIVSFFLFVIFIGFLLLGISIFGTIYSSIMLSKYGRLNVDNSRYELTKRILGMVDRDLPADAVINLNLIFSPSTQKEKKIQTLPHPHRSGWKMDLFEDPWLKLQGVFQDGTRFHLLATDLNRTAYGWKRGRSGKSKYKTKTKYKGTVMDLTLEPSDRQQAAVQILKQNVTGAIQLPEIARIKRLKIDEEDMRLVVSAYDSTQDKEGLYKTVAMMFLSLYQVLNLARLLAKQKTA